LAKIAAKGTAYEGISDLFTGPTGDRRLGGSGCSRQGRGRVRQDQRQARNRRRRDGFVVLNADGIKALATMPSLDELRAKLIGSFRLRPPKIAQLTTAPAAKLARVFAAYAEKDACVSSTRYRPIFNSAQLGKQHSGVNIMADIANLVAELSSSPFSKPLTRPRLSKKHGAFPPLPPLPSLPAGGGRGRCRG